MNVHPEFGVSFSLKQCRSFKIDTAATLNWLIHEMGFRRFRLMSYWDEIELQQGTYNFVELDKQIKAITTAKGSVTLCLGARQPRWPENHWPSWAWKASKAERSAALLAFIEAVVERYKNKDVIVSWQLENEALLEAFGERSEVDRARLITEFNLVKKLDNTRPVIMTTSTSWGIPIRQPIADIIGFSLYNIVFNKGAYHRSLYFPFVFRFRAFLIKVLHRRESFIHELQLEPWGPKAIWEMPTSEQGKSMSTAQIEKNVAIAKATKLRTIDVWGGEWWYWRSLKGDTSIAEAAQKALTK